MSTKRDTENQITKIMGSYLLKGYTLLDSYCPDCQTPLMKTKTSKDYCIYCNEVSVKSEQKNITDINSSNECLNGCAMIEDIKDGDDSKTIRHPNDLNSDSINLNTNKVDSRQDIERTVAIVHKKINWATKRLDDCDQISDCLQLINLIKSSLDVILSLKQLTRNQ